MTDLELFGGDDIFCKLYPTWQKEEGKILYENEHAFSIFSVTPAVPGAAVVISKYHVNRTRDLGEKMHLLYEASDQTRIKIRHMYLQEPEKIAAFYESLAQNPPPGIEAKWGEDMLKHKYLREVPIDYLVIENPVTGSMINDHAHLQLIPLRKRKGIVSMMKDSLK